MQHFLADNFSKLTINVEEKTPSLADDPFFDTETCRTPTSEEHQIPELLPCPPAPKKRKGSFSTNVNESKKIVEDKEIIQIIFPPDQDSSSSTPPPKPSSSMK
ncbi:hypothetical protein E1A91_A12G128900v1 [Gossypium mustelinum]|uniref:Uncharacterized protein n=3 Tax=Gossypium TaxID=3633 RepID=A0A2P5Y8P6_GOSBA|nr:hypothetical protein ES319_A12G126800v1 [Gossypium barbadense]PPS11964.1 hypothetical protein GOBAR_AA08673 [Gossypium barbadense]TYG89888.1 hypothetical protein ES288_A12G137500v1 [Gossypium darwinii]TYJ04935.1 hypothetical protein E1A91_A12G128900v1 [Gossypium mustelinum]